jgi:hypothetical protein
METSWKCCELNEVLLLVISFWILKVWILREYDFLRHYWHYTFLIHIILLNFVTSYFVPELETSWLIRQNQVVISCTYILMLLMLDLPLFWDLLDNVSLNKNTYISSLTTMWIQMTLIVHIFSHPWFYFTIVRSTNILSLGIVEAVAQANWVASTVSLTSLTILMLGTTN